MTTPTLTNRPASPASLDLEKKEDFQVETVTATMSEDDAAFLASFDDKRKARMYRKIDVRLLPMLALLYLFACEWGGGGRVALLADERHRPRQHR